MTLRINRDSLFYAPIYLMLLGHAAILCFEPRGFEAIVSIGTWLIVLSSIYIFVQNIVTKRMVDKVTLVLFLLIVCICMSLIMYGKFSYSTIVSIGCFLEIPIFLCAYRHEIRERVKDIICIVYVGLSVYFILLSLSPLAYVYVNKWGTTTIPELTLSYGNPNEAAMYLFSSIVVLTSYIPRTHKKFYRISLEILVVALYFLVFLTQSRTVILVSLVFAVLCFLYKNKIVPNWVRNVIFATPLVFVLVVVLFQENVVNIQILGDALDTGRTDIYMMIIKDMSIWNFILGDFSYQFTNLHNAIISIFATIGLGGTFAFYIILYSRLKMLHRYINYGLLNKFAYIGLLCIVLHTATEAAFFSGGSVFAMSFINIYILSLPENNNQNM